MFAAEPLYDTYIIELKKKEYIFLHERYTLFVQKSVMLLLTFQTWA